MKIKVKPVIFTIIIFIAGGIVGTYLWGIHNHDRGKIKVSGNIEGDDVRLSFRVQGQIIELLTDEGKVVKAGESVARLNTDELIKIRDNAKGSLNAAQHQYMLDKLDYERAENLFKAGAIPAFPAHHKSLQA